jgi:hypothetical protein
MLLRNVDMNITRVRDFKTQKMKLFSTCLLASKHLFQSDVLFVLFISEVLRNMFNSRLISENV